MKANVGQKDKLIRTSIALALGIIAMLNIVTGVLKTILLIIAVILAITAFLNFCPLYSLLGKNTCETK